MAILLPGGAGFIGSHTAVELLNAGKDIVIIDDFSNSKPSVVEAIKKITGKDFKFYELDYLNKEELEKKLKVFSEFSMAVDRMIAGEYVDTEYEGKEITEEYLYYIHKNKTGALLKLSVRMGAILAGVNEEDLNKLTNYADKIGLAFQIKDDILSEEGNQEILGKPVGNDKKLGKCTYVSKYGLEKAKEILKESMEKAAKLEVPLKVEISEAKTWYDAK